MFGKILEKKFNCLDDKDEPLAFRNVRYERVIVQRKYGIYELTFLNEVEPKKSGSLEETA